MSSELISIIIPVYNVEAYLKECADSIMGQTYGNFEAIFVDDGSTDSSGDICDSLKELDARFRVIHQKNKGLSGARNTGLAHTKGEYICFVDSDDFISPDYLAEMIDAIKSENADLAICDVDSTKLCEPAYDYKSKCVLKASECRDWLRNTDSREYVLMVVAWNKLYSKQLLEGFCYEEGKWHEDEFAINKIIYKLNSAVFVPKKLYKYRDNTAGITGDSNKYNAKHLDVFDAYQERIFISIKNRDFGFTNVTLANTLFKLTKLYFENHKMATEYKKIFCEIFNKYKRYLDKKQSAKYQLFMKFPRVYGKIFNLK